MRGRTEDNVFNLLREGISESGKKPDVEIIPESANAVFNTFDNAVKGELVVILTDTVSKDID